MAACTATPAGTPTASTPAASTPAGTRAASSAAPSTTVQPSPSASPSQSPSPSPSSSEPPQIASVLTVSPAQIETAIGKVDGLADTIMRKSGIPGMAVAVVQGGRTAFAKGYGVRKVGEPARVDADTVFQLASLSKSVGRSSPTRSPPGRWTGPHR